MIGQTIKCIENKCDAISEASASWDKEHLFAIRDLQVSL